MVIVAALLFACGDDEAAEPSRSADDDELTAATTACESAADDVAPGGTVLLVVPQSVAEVQATEPDAWPSRSGDERVIGCVYQMPASSSTTTCPNGEVRMEGSGGATISVRLDFDGAIDGEPEVQPSDLCGVP
jgi:hypothetical protein